MKTGTALAVGAAGVGLIALVVKEAHASGPPHNFKVGDLVVYKVPAPTNVVQRIDAVHEDTATYDWSQWYQGRGINPQYNMPFSLIDASFVLYAGIGYVG